MPRRRALTTAQLDELFTLPTDKSTLDRYWTLTDTDLEAIRRRRRDCNRLGFALQLCVLRYPGRLLRKGELIPAPVLCFVADQIDITPEALAAYAARFHTRYEQLGALRADFGFVGFTPERGRGILAWLLPVALTTTSAARIAATLMDELRRGCLIVPGPSLVISRLAWARQLPGAPGYRAMARLVEQRSILRAIGIDPAWAERVHPERLRKLASEGARFTAQHLRALSLLRRRATLVATVLDTITRLADEHRCPV
jgi:Domain of unknown function (DUF4158)